MEQNMNFEKFKSILSQMEQDFGFVSEFVIKGESPWLLSDGIIFREKETGQFMLNMEGVCYKKLDGSQFSDYEGYLLMLLEHLNNLKK